MAALPFYALAKATEKPRKIKYNSNPQTIGEHIRKKRVENGLDQRDVAAMLNTCTDTITGWENGRSKPVISWYPNIIKFLGYYPFDHSANTAAGLIERCRHLLGLSYEELGKRAGVHGSTLIYWKRNNLITNQRCKQKLLQLANAAPSLPP